MSESDPENSLIEKAASLIREAGKATALTGAGISAESGIPTFRGKDGLWQKYDPEELATESAFRRNPERVWEWYWFRIDLVRKAKPNPGHLALAEMERLHPDFMVMTQNVDGLHFRAGSRNVLEFHGNIMRARCTSCGRKFDVDEIKREKLPRCPECGDLLRPDVVWFGESLDPDVLEKADKRARETDLLLVVGTSLLVYPAASIPLLAKEREARIIEVNLEETYISAEADISFRNKAGEVLPLIAERLRRYYENRS